MISFRPFPFIGDEIIIRPCPMSESSENPQGSNRACERPDERCFARCSGIEWPIQRGKSTFHRDQQLPNLDENLVAGTMRTHTVEEPGSHSPSPVSQSPMVLPRALRSL